MLAKWHCAPLRKDKHFLVNPDMPL